MTNKEFRSDLAKEMRTKYNERNEELESIEKSPYSEWLKEQMRKEIMDNFYEEMDKMKTRPWYEEARKTHLQEIKAKIKLAQPTIEPTRTAPVEDLGNSEDKESESNDWKYLKLYERQNETAKQLEKRAEEKKVKDRDWNKLFFSPRFLNFDNDIVIYSWWMPSVQPHIFSMKDWTFEEVPLLPEKIYYDGENGVICRDIRIVENWVYSIELVHMENGRVEHHNWSDYNEMYFIDKSWKILNQVWKLWTILDNRGISHERHMSKNFRWFRELQEEEYEWNKNIKSKLTIFDKKFNVLFTIENSQQYQVQYCDEEICICQDTKEYFPKKYIIVDKTWIIAQWTEDELKSNEHMQKFLEKEEKNKKNEKKMKIKKEKREYFHFEKDLKK